MKSPAREPLSSRACALIAVVGRAFASVRAVFLPVVVLGVDVPSVALSSNDNVMGKYSGLGGNVIEAHIES
jgi:hypothetical protein